ncbi:MAG: Rieske 2Fe-2S domain-containing protein [Betaproteobacteria bacterium]|nr:Rieske 2Fe-2S domain-containing protein [Betaproteobacteria bacterium]
MADHERIVCESAALVEGGRGMRFDVPGQDRVVPCFAIRFDGEVVAYVNSCPHRGTELDWQHGEFFDESGLYLICATHGAAFDPASGECVSGPCAGERLFRIGIREEHGRVVLESDTGAAQSS